MKKILIILTTLTMLLSGCSSIDEKTNKIEEQGLIKYVGFDEDELYFTMDVMDDETMEERETKCIWKTDNPDTIDLLKKDLEYARNSETKEIIKVIGEINSNNIVEVYDIAYLGESLGGIPIFRNDNPEQFLKVYADTGNGYYHKEIEENKYDLDESDYTIDISDYLDVTCDEAVKQVPIQTKIVVKGLVRDVIKDNYNNFYFDISDSENTIEAFWYNNNNDKYQKIKQVLANAFDTYSEVKVYGVYKENPKKLGEYNLYVHDVIVDDTEEIYSEYNTNDMKDTQVITNVTLENIDEYKPTNVRLYASPSVSMTGTTLAYNYDLYYDKVEGIEEYYIICEHQDESHAIKITGNSPWGFYYAHELKKAYVVGYIGNKVSQPSDYIN